MNDDKIPQSNIHERLQKIAEAQKEIHEVTPSPEQIAYEQVLKCRLRMKSLRLPPESPSQT